MPYWAIGHENSTPKQLHSAPLNCTCTISATGAGNKSEQYDDAVNKVFLSRSFRKYFYRSRTSGPRRYAAYRKRSCIVIC